MDDAVETWLEEAISRHERLTEIVTSLVQSLLKQENIEFLTVTGRTKTKQSALDKIQRKGYKAPRTQLTDLSGIRVILYFESQLARASEVINNAFNVDLSKSLNRESILSVDQTGYRSYHFVCDLGETRGTLPEFRDLANLKFEFQIRTVLQHAWAELAHDRNYKLSAKLPRELERSLYLYAGLLELADKGFDSLSREIDKYITEVNQKTNIGDLDVEINSFSLESFVNQWVDKSGFSLEKISTNYLEELVNELVTYGIQNLKELASIIPEGYAEKALEINYSTTIYGLIRDWLLIHDWRGFTSKVQINWGLPAEDDGTEMLSLYLEHNELVDLIMTINNSEI